MKTIATHTYTNVVLTAIALLLAALLVRPHLKLESAQAAETTSREDSRRPVQLDPTTDMSDAIRQVAQANQQIAQAIRDSARAQQDAARALFKLSENPGR